mgnify:CR=1 FL=1
MRKKITFLFLALASTLAVAQQPVGADTLRVAEPVVEKRIQSADLTFAEFDTIRTHGSLLYAGKILSDAGFKMAYANELNQKDWNKYHMGETAFVKGATFNEQRQAWKREKNAPFAYMRLIYDYENQRLCHYQLKFATREGFSLFHKEAILAGYLFKKKNRDRVDSGVESTYYNVQTDCFMVFGEYADGQLTVDCWKGGQKIGHSHRK